MGDTGTNNNQKISVLFKGLSEMEVDSQRFETLKDGMVEAAEATSGRGVQKGASSEGRNSVLVTFNGTNPDAIIPFLEQRAAAAKVSLECEDLGVCDTDHDKTDQRRVIEVTYG